MLDVRSRLGLLRSRFIYLWQPFNRRRLRRFYGRFVRPGALCFDIGAHLGSRCRAFLDLGARVVALEPQPRCAAYLRGRWGGDERFVLVAKAIGARPGTATLHINRMNPTISTLAGDSWRAAMAAAAGRRERWDHPVEVQVTTLDRLIQECGRPDFCKIDVEGFEVQALAGLSIPIPALSFEFISFEVARALACVRRLNGLGPYRFNWSFRERLRLESPTWVGAPGVEQMLRRLGPKIVSGDIYACSADPHL
ncbi:MAG: FkbM family methyltransferase [Desulfobacterales bacterium]|jgi:FkbM family methyltransferase|nr:FkbM family methyltransferase [Desulfobacterales bacterium]